MTPEEREHFEEFLLKAVQSGKSETSALVSTIMHKMEKELEPVVDKLVNGKIKSLDTKLDDYIVSDNKWKEKYSPMLETFDSLSISSKFVLKFILGLGALFAAIITIKNGFK